MNDELLQKLDELKPAMIDALGEFIKIPSFYQADAINDEHPFGKSVTDALNFMCALAHQYDLDVVNYDNKVVEIIAGSGDKNITLLGHVDVVPPSEGQLEPFVMKNVDDILYGRGVSDDKGPLLATFFALVALTKLNMLGNYQVRLLCGGNEESGSLCMKHYFHILKKPQPTIGFTPDSNFPIIFAEKGIINFSLSKKMHIPGILSIEGGSAINAVMDKCVIKAELNSEIIPLAQSLDKDVKIVTVDDVVTLTFNGLSSHGSTPNKGINAGNKAIHFLAEYCKNLRIIALDKRFGDIYGRGIHCHDFNLDMGQNTLNLGCLSYNDNVLVASYNFRYINTTDVKDVKEKIVQYSEGLDVKFLDEHPLLYFAKDSLLVKTLLNCYNSVTNRHELPLAIGGGTYAKEAANIVAFGAEMPGFDTYMHTANERIKLSDLYLAQQIYAQAILDLGKLIDENKI